MNWDSLKQSRWLWILGLLGLVLLGIGSWTRTSPTEKPVGPAPSDPPPVPADGAGQMENYERAYEQRLTAILNQLPGISGVRVMVNVDSTEEVVYAHNEQQQQQTVNETDKQGGTRVTTSRNGNDQVVVIKQGTEQPLVVKRLRPQVRGVLVAAKGAENANVRIQIVQAVQSVLNVPPHRIAVIPSK